MDYDEWNAMNATERLAITDYVVEATSCEKHFIWCRYHHEPREGFDPIHKWEQHNSGSSVTVGSVGNMPVVLSLFWASLDDKLVCFYEAISTVVDWRMINGWIEEHFTKKDNGLLAQCNADNFHICYHFIKGRN